MNICLISREYPSEDHAGGVGTYTEKTARALARLGQTVSVITEAGGPPSVEVEDGVSVHRLPPVRLFGNLPYSRTFARTRAVAQYVKKLHPFPDIVQACEHGSEAFWYSLDRHPGTKLVTRLATPTVMTTELNPHSGSWRIRTHYHDWMEREQTRRSDAIISPSDALADAVCRRWGLPRDRVTTIRTGVDFAERYASSGTEAPPELHGREYLIYFGRLEERKGVHILAQALPKVFAANPQLGAVFAGNNFLTYNGEAMQAFIERCNAENLHRIYFFPRLPQHRLYPLVAHSLFAVLPSLWESLSNAALESLDLGKPVVATRGGGFAEVIEDGRSGLLVPGGSVDALTEAIMSLLADRDRLTRMSQAAKARAESFRLSTVSAQLLGFYESLRDGSR